MIYHKYHIRPTTTFKEELEDIIYYIKQKLKEVYSKTRILRKTSVNNYIIIYEVKNDTRRSLYFTYFS